MSTRRGEPSDPAGPVPIAEILDHALQRLAPIASSAEHGDALLFSGNPHESVPRRLLLDARLTPLERNAWQVIRMLLDDRRLMIFPTYDQLRPYLTSTPCTGRASNETIARALLLLRLTRWLTWVRHRRDPATGRVQGNVYVLHDEPLTPQEAIQLGPRYLELVVNSLSHSSKVIQHVAVFTLKEVTEVPSTPAALSPRLRGLLEKLASPQFAEITLSSDSELGQPSESDRRLRSESERRKNTVKSASVRNPNTVSTVRTEDIYKDSVLYGANNHPRLKLPEAFARLRREQQLGALAALENVETDLQQLVMDEWAARCNDAAIRNPAGYLFGIIQKALRGEFRAWAAQKPQAQVTMPTKSATREPPPAAAAPPLKKSVQEHIAELRRILNSP